jgi:hypothetical protein
MSWPIFPSRPRLRTPLANEEPLLVEPKPNGFWQLRFQDSPPEDAFGSFPSSEAASLAAHEACQNVRVLTTPSQPRATTLLTTAEERIYSLLRQINSP